MWMRTLSLSVFLRSGEKFLDEILKNCERPRNVKGMWKEVFWNLSDQVTSNVCASLTGTVAMTKTELLRNSEILKFWTSGGLFNKQKWKFLNKKTFFTERTRLIFDCCWKKPENLKIWKIGSLKLDLWWFVSENWLFSKIHLPEILNTMQNWLTD